MTIKTLPQVPPLDEVEELRRDRDRYRALVEVTSDWVWEVDAQGRYTYASPQCRTLLGFEPEEMIGRTPFDFMPPGEAERVGAEFAGIVADRRAFSGLVNINRRRDGRDVVLETSGVPLFGADGELLGYRGVDRDISERHRAYQATRELADGLRTLALRFQQERDRTKAASEEQMRFVAVMTHELRTPLNTIIGFSAEILQEPFGPIGHGAYRDHLREVHDGGLRLLSIVNDILDHAQLQVGGVIPVMEPASPGEMLASIARFVLPAAGTRGVLVETRVAPALPNVRCDQHLLRQALINLVDNAIAASPSGATVTLSASLSKAGEPVLDVEDHGIGMTAEELILAVSPFGRVGGAAQQGAVPGLSKGTGLGLPIAVRLAELHGGRLTLDSRPGEGTRAAIILPVASLIPIA